MKTQTNPKPNDPEFTFYWNVMIDEISQRKNFSPSHLLQFKVLCDAYVQYDFLLERVMEQGHVIVKITDKGETPVINPYLTQLNKVINQIKEYSRMLGLLLVKDVSEPKENDEDDEWA